MNKSRSISRQGAITLAGMLLLGPAAAAGDPAVPAVTASPVAPPAPVAPAAPSAPNQAKIDRELAAAQRQLEQAANEVARLSTQLSTAMVEEVMPVLEPHVVIGVQLEKTPDNTGARVREVSPGGPAAEAGMREGDVLVALNGTELKGDAPARQVTRILRTVQPDTHVSARVLRQGKALDLTVTPRGGPGFFAPSRGMQDFDLALSELPEVLMHRPLQDMELVTLTPRLGSYFGSERGILVVRAPSDGALKLEDGDVILAIDGREPKSGAHATRILSSYQSGEKVTLRIIRQHKPIDLQTTLPERAAHRETLHSSLLRTPAAPLMLADDEG